MSDFAFQTLEGLARDNRWNELDNLMSIVRTRQFKDSELVHLASMARRAYKLTMALKILRKIVTDQDGVLDERADPKALSEYATCLIMMGARKYAKKVLEVISSADASNLFAWVTLYFSESEYEKAIPYLKRYIALVDDEYKEKVGELNLCACYVGTSQFERAESYLSGLKTYFDSNGHKTLLANAEELHGQVHIYNQEWNLASQCLSRAGQLNADGNKLYSLFIDKWKLVLAINIGAASVRQVHAFVSKANKMKNAQSSRDVLYHWATKNSDYELLKKIYFGTPFGSYRKMMLKKHPELGVEPTVAWNGNWFFHDWSREFKIQKVATGSMSLSKNEIKALEALTEDFFEPKSVGSLFEAIFPDEFLNPEYSIGKTYKIIQRLNKKLRENNIPMTVLNSNNIYFLDIDAGWMVETINPEFKNQGKMSTAEGRLLSEFHSQAFTRLEVMDVFHLEKSTAVRWLKELRNKGLVEKVGRGPGSFYRISA